MRVEREGRRRRVVQNMVGCVWQSGWEHQEAEGSNESFGGWMVGKVRMFLPRTM